MIHKHVLSFLYTFLIDNNTLPLTILNINFDFIVHENEIIF